MKIFISGPVTGTTDYMERFSNAQKYLESLGHSVINPVLVTSNLPEDTTRKEYLSLDLTMLCMCDAIYMLCGYGGSKGALAELAAAKSVGCKIFHEADLYKANLSGTNLTEDILRGDNLCEAMRGKSMITM